jgi:hypothetical protein
MSRTNAAAAIAVAVTTVAAGTYAAAAPEASAMPVPEAGPSVPVHQEVQPVTGQDRAQFDSAGVPARPAVTRAGYTVRAGDTLSWVAAQFCGSADAYPHLAAGNGIANPDYITVGELVRLTCHAAVRAVVTSSYSDRVTPVRHRDGDGDYDSDSGDSDDASSGHSSGAVTYASAPQVHVTGFSGTLSYSGLEALWLAAGGPGWAEARAASIAECESGGNQWAHNPSGASGYWQILGEVVPGDVYDPMVNAENAVAKFRASGDTFAQWVCQG